MRVSEFAASALFALGLSVPMASPAATAPAVAVTPAALALPAPRAGRPRPLVAIVADNAGTQTTDFTIPYGVLKDSGVAEVRSVSTHAGPVRLTRGLTIEADETLADFDAREAGGADIVIVPALADPKRPEIIKWLRTQAAKGAVIVSVCEGARVLALAGLLEGKQAVTHWASLDSMSKAYPRTRWVRDRRYLQDGGIITTTGVTASMPVALALVEAIGGRDTASATAERFGVQSWSAAHRTADFTLGKADMAEARSASKQAGEITEIPIADGVDEVSLALQAEIWGRSLRTKVATTHAGRAPVRSRHGLVVLPDAEAQADHHVVEPGGAPALQVLESTLAEMGRRYGPGAVRLAVMAMEYDVAPPAD
jgi:transcriptional regulator GlxA family with amidase domain